MITPMLDYTRGISLLDNVRLDFEESILWAYYGTKEARTLTVVVPESICLIMPIQIEGHD
jgi:hypothetical protein